MYRQTTVQVSCVEAVVHLTQSLVLVYLNYSSQNWSLNKLSDDELLDLILYKEASSLLVKSMFFLKYFTVLKGHILNT